VKWHLPWTTLGRPIRACVDGWNTFWFTPADPTVLGLVRIVTGLVLLHSLILTTFHLSSH
jgi:tetrahydromethanopterin S-methyltransferase subunit E